MSIRRSVVAFLLFTSVAVADPVEPPPEPKLWIVVTTEPLAAALGPLVERRRSQGWQVERVLVDEQNMGAEAVVRRYADLVEKFDGRCVVLLLGGYGEGGIPAFEGTHGRMKGRTTDHGYGLPDAKEAARIAVGRLPARSLDEAKSMVARTLALEDRPSTTGIERVHLVIGDPGAKSKLEERFARSIVKNLAETRLAKVHPMWRPVCIADVPGSRFSVTGKPFDTTTQRLLTEGHLLVGYAGHSGAAGLWAPGRREYSVPRSVFEEVDTSRAPGILVSCGCFGCDVDGREGEGYVLAAVRNPKGPAAGIGAFGESYAAFGQLALDGVVEQLSGDDPPRTLGRYWLAAQNGLVNGKIGGLQFWLYDQADGSGGKVPLDDQRLEHAEMWTLLGDPALRIPFVRPSLSVTVEGEAKPGVELAITVEIPVPLRGGSMTVRIEPRQLRWADVAPAAAPLAATEVEIDGTSATVRLTLPGEIPEGDIVIRVRATRGKTAESGVLAIERAAE